MEIGLVVWGGLVNVVFFGGGENLGKHTECDQKHKYMWMDVS